MGDRWSSTEHTTDGSAVFEHEDSDTVVMGRPKCRNEEAVGLAAAAGKAVLCTKPLGRTAAEARRMLAVVEKAGVFGGYLEDLCYTPKTLTAVRSVEGGAICDVTWVRSREAHPGPHRAGFADGRPTVAARWLALGPKILIVDEPTRGIDVGAKVEVHNLLFEMANAGIAIIAISSELPEILAVSDRIVTMREGRVTGEILRDAADPEKLMTMMTAPIVRAA